MKIENMIDIFYQKQRIHTILNKRKVVYKYNDNKTTYLNKDLWINNILNGFKTNYNIYDLTKIYDHFYPGTMFKQQFTLYNKEWIQKIKFITMDEYLNSNIHFISLSYPIYDFNTWEIIKRENINSNLSVNGDIFYAIGVDNNVNTLYIITSGYHIILPNNLSYFFQGFAYLIEVDFNNIVTVENEQSVINLEGICENLDHLETIDFNQLNIKQISTLKNSFYNCESFTNQLQFLTNINQSTIQNMENAFAGCKNLTELDISKLNISQVISMENAFAFCGLSYPEGQSIPHSFNFTINLMNVLSQAYGKLKNAFHACNLGCISNITFDFSNNNTINIDENCFSSAYMPNATIIFDNRRFTEATTPEGCFSGSRVKEVSLKNVFVEAKYPGTSYNILKETEIINEIRADKIYLNNATFDTFDLGDIPSFTTYTLLDLRGISFNNLWYWAYPVTDPNCRLNLRLAATAFYEFQYNKYGEINFSGYQFLYPDILKATGALSDGPGTGTVHMISADGYIPAGYADSAFAGFQTIYTEEPAFKLTKLNLSYTNLTGVDLRIIKAWHWEPISGRPNEYTLEIDETYPSYIEEIDLSHNTNSDIVSLGVYNSNNIKAVDFSYNTSKYQPYVRSSGLESLNLSNSTYTIESTFSLYDLPNVETLNISNITLPSTLKSIEFNGLNSLTNLNLNNFIWSNVNNIERINFQYCENLTSLDLSPIPSLNIVNAEGIFKYCLKLTSINFGNLNLNNCITGGKELFYNCKSLTQLNLSSFNFSSFQDCTDMFGGCSALTQIILPQMNNIINMTKMFDGCSSLIDINFNNINTSNVTNMSFLFNGCTSFTSIIISNIISNFITDNVTNINNMFAKCTGLTTIDINSFNTSNIINMGGLFSSCVNLTSISLNNIDTSNVTNMSALFYNCSSLTTLNINNFDTSNVTEMSSMFYGCTNLLTLNINNFDTSKVNYMNHMFYNCSSLTSLDVSNFDTSNVISLHSIFEKCSNLTLIDVSNFNINKVWKDHSRILDNNSGLNSMFKDCERLNSITLFDINIPEQTIPNMIYGINLEKMFENCKSLITINLKHFHYYYHKFDEDNTRFYGTLTNDMFKDCNSLTTINTYSQLYDNTSDYNSLFSNCNSLIGGNGTTFANEPVLTRTSNVYARVDTNNNKGYFTLI